MRILLIEDDRALCTALLPALQAAGYTVDTCHDGADGKALLCGGAYDVCVLDRMLPGLLEKGFVVKADTIEELARKLGLPAEELKRTVDRYNALARKGIDEDYGKESFRLTPVDKAPFYGAKNTGYVLCTMDGIQIDTHMNAIDTDGNPIPGLYVIGNDSGCFFANEYPNLATGMACGRTVTFGRIVGIELARS
mgnify:CR=1 FL=1